jgi:hypothetical protein
MDTSAWWPCPTCGSPVPFAYQLEESFEPDGRARFDPAEHLQPARDDDSLTASWLRVVRCPNDDCDSAWVLILYPTTKERFQIEVDALEPDVDPAA